MTTSQPDPMDHDDRVAQSQAAVRSAAAGSTEWALAIDPLAEAWLAATISNARSPPVGWA
jgi:hypothetical protein